MVAVAIIAAAVAAGIPVPHYTAAVAAAALIPPEVEVQAQAWG